ncbi:MAG: tRNA uridine-5-carboxymethylaminomethyl(34) synthesis enzyme MnmG [Firmicutes bacterium]|nr:tRNA uridine-5-carboxymethylaminomethyl(34) synthesis enzyme MnmG [Bacillota bacterium]
MTLSAPENEIKNHPSAFENGSYDVIVAGGGHAGCEAALAAARLGCRTLLITLTPENVAMAPCNPAIGGPAKSVLVREIDALGGAMARVTDRALIQIRMLNSSKGPAVRALRAQIDKPLYQRLMLLELQGQENLDLRLGEVTAILTENGAVAGVRCANGAVYRAPAVIVCSGTYLNGKILIGEYEASSGPLGHAAAKELGEWFKAQGFAMARFKTGTPARIDRRSIDFSKTQIQEGERGLHFSYLTPDGGLDRPMIPCWLTYTNERTHEIIRANLHRAPLYSGRIEGVGPRYCPSIEDKVVRFADRSSHQLFLEPESELGGEYYVQGMSSSLPEEVQLAFLQTIPGLGHCRIVRPAYAIEYDCIDPLQLDSRLMMRELPGLYCAGQINGTSGYEEAAAQGLLAGINAAARILGLPPFFMDRAESYTGVLADDLITKGVDEPYRLFTSRSEYRLLLRQDNADLRLTGRGLEYPGLISEERKAAYLRRRAVVEQETARLERTHPGQAGLASLGVEAHRELTLASLLQRPELSYAELTRVFPPDTPLAPADAESVEVAVKYAGYIQKQLAQVERFRALEHRLLPPDYDFTQIKALSAEAAQKLNRYRPQSIGQASRISGVSPADINVLLVWLKK